MNPMLDDLDPSYDREAALGDMSRVSNWLADQDDDDCQSAASDLNCAIIYFTVTTKEDV